MGVESCLLKQPIKRNFAPLAHCYSDCTSTRMALCRVREALQYCLMAVKLDPTFYREHNARNDSALIRKAAQMLLDYHGFKTIIVENGQEAVDMFIAGNCFDVVFMDMEMPVMDGIQATKELRAMGVKSLIYGVTASESETEIQAFVEAGLDEYCQKPLNAVMIDSVMKRLNREY